mmetsp:Transcript_33208/g.23942  ORF Transcript_33208/g.23942 Transcript_33208/m.23942 type:complete len:97 (+) Transcript_33208:333-623(+)
MIDRGDCTFVTKVRNAQKIGVKFVIIADNTREYTEELVMADDGTGDTITIPSMIIRKSSADMIKQSIGVENKVIIKIDMEFMKLKTNEVNIELWYS